MDACLHLLASLIRASLRRTDARSDTCLQPCHPARPMQHLDVWNPFDVSEKTCFPDLHEALQPGSTLLPADTAVVDIDVLARHHPADIDEQHPPNLGLLPQELSNTLEARCQAWFDEQTRIKAARVRTATVWISPGTLA